MIVVADSSPLNYLILLEQTALLHRLYGSVLVPEAVAVELRTTRAPQPVREWIRKPPSWIEIIEVSDNEVASVAGDLDRGERAAIALAERVRADLILIDEVEGRIEAARRSFRVTGTLGVLGSRETISYAPIRVPALSDMLSRAGLSPGPLRGTWPACTAALRAGIVLSEERHERRPECRCRRPV